MSSENENEGGVLVKKRSKTKKPKKYKVLFHNDDYTTMEFVVEVLKYVFRKTPQEAQTIMRFVHEKGYGVAGVYTYSIAETKVTMSLELARQEGHPLMVTMEPE